MPKIYPCLSCLLWLRILFFVLCFLPKGLALADTSPTSEAKDLVLSHVESKYALFEAKNIVDKCNAQGFCYEVQFQFLAKYFESLQQHDGVNLVLELIKNSSHLLFKDEKLLEEIKKIDPTETGLILCHALSIALAQQNKKNKSESFVYWYIRALENHQLLLYKKGKALLPAGVSAGLFSPKDLSLAMILAKSSRGMFSPAKALLKLQQEAVVFAAVRRDLGEHTLNIVRVGKIKALPELYQGENSSLWKTFVFDFLNPSYFEMPEDFIYRILDYYYPKHTGLIWNNDYYQRNKSYAKGGGFKYLAYYSPFRTGSGSY